MDEVQKQCPPANHSTGIVTIHPVCCYCQPRPEGILNHRLSTEELRKKAGISQDDNFFGCDPVEIRICGIFTLLFAASVRPSACKNCFVPDLHRISRRKFVRDLRPLNGSPSPEGIMSISSVSSSQSTYQPSRVRGELKQVREDFSGLVNALQSGDLSGAQSACSALQQLMQGMQPGSQSQPQGNATQNQFSTDLAAIGKALQSGDVTSAKDALAKLQQDMQAAPKGHHHHHGHRAEGTNVAASSSTGSAATGATNGDGSTTPALNITA